MIYPTPHRPSQTPPPRNPNAGDLGERLELLRLRDSDDPAARAIALFGSQLLRRLDDLAKAMGVAA